MAKRQGQYADAGEDSRKKASSFSGGSAGDPPFRWCELPLSVQAKEAIQRMDFDGARFIEWVFAMLDDGYKVTFGIDDKSSCYIVTVIGRRRSRGDYNVGFSSRHVHWQVVMNTCLYKWETLLMGGPIPTEALDVKADVWD